MAFSQRHSPVGLRRTSQNTWMPSDTWRTAWPLEDPKTFETLQGWSCGDFWDLGTRIEKKWLFQLMLEHPKSICLSWLIHEKSTRLWQTWDDKEGSGIPALWHLSESAPMWKMDGTWMKRITFRSLRLSTYLPCFYLEVPWGSLESTGRLGRLT